MLTADQHQQFHVTNVRNCVQQATKNLGYNNEAVEEITENTIKLYMLTKLYMSTSSYVPLDNPPAIVIVKTHAQEYSDALADVLQWFRGFCAAVAMRGSDAQAVDLPSGLPRLTDLNLVLKKGFDKS